MGQRSEKLKYKQFFCECITILVKHFDKNDIRNLWKQAVKGQLTTTEIRQVRVTENKRKLRAPSKKPKGDRTPKPDPIKHNVFYFLYKAMENHEIETEPKDLEQFMMHWRWKLSKKKTNYKIFDTYGYRSC